MRREHKEPHGNWVGKVEWELGECEFRRRGKQWHLVAETPKHSHQHQLSNAQRTSEALEAAGSVRLKQQEIYSLFKE